jgi:hypothetical protein
MKRTMLLTAGAMTLFAACGGEGSGTSGDPKREAPRQVAGLPEQLGTRPASACGWISVEDVEAVVGKLNGEPREQDGGCFYPLPVDSITIARRVQAEKMRASLEKAGYKSDWPAEPEDTGGVVIHVSVGVGPEERPAEMAFATVGSWVGDDSLLAAQKAADGWDYRRRMIGKPNFWGRAGTLMVVVEGRTFGMKDSALATLATRVRDRVPDLPFADPSASSVVPPGTSPCTVLSTGEAEEVLGKLMVPPYRVREGGALADPAGDSCAYFTGKHRALVITPHVVGGLDEMRYVRSGGGLAAIGMVDREAVGADTLEGPWDEAAIGVNGELGVLRGDRLLKIAYLTSSTDLPGAMRLAAPALRRLESAR